MNLYGRDMEKRELQSYIGDLSQVAGIQSAVFDEGKGAGVKFYQISTGSGLRYMVLPSRGMDICYAEYKGIPLSFVSQTGIVNGNFYEHDYDGFHRNFFAGLLTTCGLRNVGKSCDDGEPLGLHGRISNIPAEEVSSGTVWRDSQQCEFSVSGKIRESKLYGENLLMTRKITSNLGESKICITDSVENCGFTEEPFTLLYHINFGYPLLNESSRLYFPEGKMEPRDTSARDEMRRYREFSKPKLSFPETVFYHEREANEFGRCYAAIYNPDLEIGVTVTYNKDNLPYMAQWKNMVKGEYVTALEPANCFPDGRQEIREKGMLCTLKPGEIRNFRVELTVGTNARELVSIGEKSL